MIRFLHQSLPHGILQNISANSYDILLAPSDMIIVAPLPQGTSMPLPPDRSSGVALELLKEAKQAAAIRFWRDGEMQMVGHQAIDIGAPMASF